MLCLLYPQETFKDIEYRPEKYTCLHMAVSTHPEAVQAEFSRIWSLREECIEQTCRGQGMGEVLPGLSIKVDVLERKITNIPQQLGPGSISKKGFTSGKELPAGNWVCWSCLSN